MKAKYSMFLAVSMIIVAATVKAQNRCALKDNMSFMSEIQVSDNQTIKKIDDNQIIITSNPKRNHILTPNKAVYTLTIQPEGNVEGIHINNDAGFEDFCHSNLYQGQVSEGLYDIVIIGSTEDGERAILSYEQFEVSSDVIFTPSMTEAVNTITLDVFDENGISINEIPVIDETVAEFSYTFVMSHGSMTLTGLGRANKNSLEIASKFNDLGNRSTIYAYVLFYTEQQKFYNVQYIITDGIEGSVVLSNDQDELSVHKEYYNLNNSNAAFVGYESKHYGPTLDAWYQSKGYQANCTFNSNEPLLVITNMTNNNEPIVEHGSNMKYAFAPMVFESKHNTDFFRYMSVNAPGCMYLNHDGNMVRQIFDPSFSSDATGINPPSFPDMLNSPAMYIFEPTKTQYFGYRTPLLFNYLSINYRAENSPFGTPVFGGWISYLGETGAQRKIDESNIVRITYNGETYFEDSLYLANTNYLMNFENPAMVTYDIVNDNVEVDDVAKTNITHIEFDMNRDDAQPPTLYLLQVLNEHNEEIIEIEDLEHSRINFAGGDYHVDLENMYMVYEEAANIELFYKTANSDYESLEFIENEAMLHINYGNFYEVNLSQLAGKVNDEWVTVKFVLTDEEGNLQEQELQNLFYIVDNTSVNESTAATSTVYPNPFQTSFTVNAVNPVSGKAVVNVYNVLGENVYTKAMNCNNTTEFVIDGSSLNAGIYFYNIATENGELKGRIVKE